MGKLGRDWSRGVEVTVPVTGGGGNNQAWPLCWPLVSSKIGGRRECLYLMQCTAVFLRSHPRFSVSPPVRV